MYLDAGYGDNWGPEGNNARRLDPYERSCRILASLFAIGFVLIIIIVLSLIPIYISQKSSTTTNTIQTTRVLITNYNLQLSSPFQTFDPTTILSNINNRLALQAALTSMLQKDSITIGSIVEIGSSTINKSYLKRRQIPDSYNITFNLNVTSDKSCLTCSNQYQSHIIKLLSSNSNQTTSFVHYQQPNNSQIYWLTYQLPSTINSNMLIVSVDPKNIESLLNSLILFNNLQNQPTIQNSTLNN